MNKTKTILATVYAVNPYKGSEDGMGWSFVYQIARFNKVIAVTRENNRSHIERFMYENPDSVNQNIHFLYFDLPYWMRFWKKKGRGALLYFWMWQKSIPGFISRKKITFDIVHNLNFHNDWTPSYLWKLGKPFVWGPIGHHPLIPAQYLKSYKKIHLKKDRLTWTVKKLFWKYSPALKKTAEKADHIFCMNKSVTQVLHVSESKCTIMPSVATEDFGFNIGRNSRRFALVSAGRLVPLKGYDLSILAFSRFIQGLSPQKRENCELLIVGSGPEKSYYQKLAREKGVEKLVRFIKWMDRKELLKLLKDASVLIFPSHEGAGMIVAEALSFGVPVICLDNCGPGEFIDKNCGISVPEQDYEGTVAALTEGISTLHSDTQLWTKMSNHARLRFESHFDWNRRGETLQTIYQNL